MDSYFRRQLKETAEDNSFDVKQTITLKGNKAQRYLQSSGRVFTFEDKNPIVKITFVNGQKESEEVITKE